MRLPKGKKLIRVAAPVFAVGLIVLLTAIPAYAVVPTITSITPASPAPGCSVTLTGANFQFPANGGPVTTLTFAGQAPVAPAVTDSDGQLEVTMPDGGHSHAATTVIATIRPSRRSASLRAPGTVRALVHRRRRPVRWVLGTYHRNVPLGSTLVGSTPRTRLPSHRLPQASPSSCPTGATTGPDPCVHSHRGVSHHRCASSSFTAARHRRSRRSRRRAAPWARASPSPARTSPA